MSDRIALLLATATFALLGASVPVQAAAPLSSGPVSELVINEPKSLVTERSPSADGGSVDPVTHQATDIGRTVDDRAVLARDAFEQPSQEAKQLGKPQGIFGGRASGNRDVAPSTPLHALDPRSNEFMRVVAALAIVLGLVVLFRTFVRRLGGPLAGGGRPSGVVEVLARYPLAKGQYLVLLKLGRRIVLLHQTRVSMTALAEVSDPDEVAALLARIEAGSRDTGSGGFQALLEGFTAQGHSGRDAGSPLVRGRWPGADGSEVIDLTRRPRRGSKALAGRRGLP